MKKTLSPGILFWVEEFNHETCRSGEQDNAQAPVKLAQIFQQLHQATHSKPAQKPQAVAVDLQALELSKKLLSLALSDLPEDERFVLEVVVKVLGSDCPTWQKLLDINHFVGQRGCQAYRKSIGADNID